jgi:hypothetical protein
MNHVIEIQRLLNQVNGTEKLLAQQVERVFILRSAHLDARPAETRLSELCAVLASHRARLTKAIKAVRGNRPSERSLGAGADVGGPRWRIGWAAHV